MLAEAETNFINPFIKGTMNTLEIQCELKASPGRGFVKNADTEDFDYRVDIAGVVGIIGPVFMGSISICFPEKTFLNIMSNMLGESFSIITSDLEDGAAELLNIIYGQAKRELNKINYSLDKIIPRTLRGPLFSVHSDNSQSTIVLPFETTAGKFHLEISTGN